MSVQRSVLIIHVCCRGQMWQLQVYVLQPTVGQSCRLSAVQLQAADDAVDRLRPVHWSVPLHREHRRPPVQQLHERLLLLLKLKQMRDVRLQYIRHRRRPEGLRRDDRPVSVQGEGHRYDVRPVPQRLLRVRRKETTSPSTSLGLYHHLDTSVLHACTGRTVFDTRNSSLYLWSSHTHTHLKSSYCALAISKPLHAETYG